MEIAGFPYFEAQFRPDGTLFDDGEATALLEAVGQCQVTDLLVLAHGWNNDMPEARGFYTRFLTRVREVMDGTQVPGLDQRSFAVLGVLWPSKRFAEKDLTPSGAASAGSAVSDADLQQQMEDLEGVFSGPNADASLAKARTLIPRLRDSPQARREFADLLRSAVPRDAADAEDGSDRLFGVDGDQLMTRLSRPILATGPASSGTGAATALSGSRGGAAGFELSLSGFQAAARRLLNYITYYQMKERAGVVGSKGVNDLLRRVKADCPQLRLHLVGHSFGGRVVTAAAVGPDDKAPLGLASMTLLQAAFSHNGFAQKYDGRNDGAFRRLVTDQMVTGPVLISHTVNDTAVGLAYPLASQIAGQAASALGDKNDVWGGIGRNGAQKTPEAVDGSLLARGGAYTFEPRKIYNLQSDAFIKDHGDVAGEQIVYAMLSGVAATT